MYQIPVDIAAQKVEIIDVVIILRAAELAFVDMNIQCLGSDESESGK